MPQTHCGGGKTIHSHKLLLQSTLPNLYVQPHPVMHQFRQYLYDLPLSILEGGVYAYENIRWAAHVRSGPGWIPSPGPLLYVTPHSLSPLSGLNFGCTYQKVKAKNAARENSGRSIVK